uniref:Uncharacterized protein n=1 Tax=Onchocerca volvulus TaxID=6282 RepID=A0A8R1Y1R5_ONCVO
MVRTHARTLARPLKSPLFACSSSDEIETKCAAAVGGARIVVYISYTLVVLWYFAEAFEMDKLMDGDEVVYYRLFI